MAGSDSEQQRRVSAVPAGLALAVALVLALAAGAADARSLTVRWRYPAPERAAGFRVHVGTTPGLYPRTIDVGKPTPDAQGVYHATIEVTEPGPVYLAVSAYGARGEESPRSNESVRAPAAAGDELGRPGRPRVVTPP